MRGCILKVFTTLIIYLISLSGCENAADGESDEDNVSSLGVLSVDFVHSIVTPDGSVWTWGNNASGALGDGSTTSSESPVRTLLKKRIISLDQSFGAVVALDFDGGIWFWGNIEIYLGPPQVDTNVVIPVEIGSLPGAAEISMNGIQLFVRTRDLNVRAYTLDFYSPTLTDGPTPIGGLGRVTHIWKDLALTEAGRVFNIRTGTFVKDSLGLVIHVSGRPERHVLAVDGNGTVWVWGNNDLGQLGDGTYTDRENPVRSIIPAFVKSVSANADFSLALDSEGRVWHWGFEGREGDSLRSRNLPTRIESISDVVLISAGHTALFRKNDGSYWKFDVSTKLLQEVDIE